MTPEREAEIRRESTVRADDCGRYARELLAALDAARAEAAMLRDSNALYREENATLIRERDAAHHSLDAARAERDELRGKVAALKQYVHDENNAGMLLRDLNHMTGNGQATKAMYCGSIEALTALLTRGRELGLWAEE